MEKFFKYTFMVLGLIIMALFVTVIGKSAYDSFTDDHESFYVDYDSPKRVFTDASTAVNVHDQIDRQYSVTDAFLAIPPNHVQLVADTLISLYGRCTQEQIVEYYDNHYGDFGIPNPVAAVLDHECDVPTPPDEQTDTFIKRLIPEDSSPNSTE